MRKKDRLESMKNAFSFYSQLSKNEKERFRKASNVLEKAEKLLLPLKDRYGLSLDELFSFAKGQLFFPVDILTKELTILESVVKYLKEGEETSLRNISYVLGRDERNIWHIYDRAKKKKPQGYVVEKAQIWVPISIFSDTKLSALESVVSYLKEEFSLNYHEIAQLLKRDDRTIWTVYQRAREKNAKQE